LVDACDFVIFRDELGKHVEPFSQSDADGDGVVDYDDFELWKANFGKGLTFSSGGGGGSAARVSDQGAETPTNSFAPFLEVSSASTRSRANASFASPVASTRTHDNALLAWLTARAKLTSGWEELADIVREADNADEVTDFCPALDAAFSTL
jgi:hypothetical protein